MLVLPPDWHTAQHTKPTCNIVQLHAFSAGFQIVYTQNATVTGIKMHEQANGISPHETPDLRDLLTVVIPTYNRRELLARALAYWATVPVQVIVMDGSATPLPTAEVQDMCASVTYVHDTAGILQRLGRAGNRITTPFVTMIGDDEFHLQSGLLASVLALQTEPDLVACMGRAMGFDLLKDGTLQGRPAYPSFADHSVLGETPIERMLHHFSNYTPSTIYGVVRTPAWRQAHSAALAQEFPAFASAEIQFELALAAIGKSKVLPVLHWLRSYESAPVRNAGEVTLTTQTRFHQWWEDPQAHEMHRAFIANSARIIAQATREPEGQTADAIRQALDAYVQSIRDMPQKRRTTLYSITSQIAAAPAPPALKHSYDGMDSFREELLTLSKCGVAFDENDVYKVVKMVTERNY